MFIMAFNRCLILLAGIGVVISSPIETSSQDIGRLNERQLEALGGGNILRSLDSIGGGHILRNLESLGGGHILRSLGQALAAPGRDKMAGVPSRAIYYPYSIRAFDHKRNFDEIDHDGFGWLVKKNFDEIDRSGFGEMIKKSLQNKAGSNKKTLEQMDEYELGQMMIPSE